MKKVESHPERISNIKPFINKYNWKGINYSSKIDDWKTLKKNNPTVALNIFYTKEKETFRAYISKINSNFEKQILLLMNPNEEKRRMALFYNEKIVYIIKRNKRSSRKIFNNKNRWSYSLWIFNVSNLEIWSYRKQAYFISWKRLSEKVLYFFNTRKI